MLLTFQVHVQIEYITTYYCTIQSTFLRYICNVHATHKLVNCIFMYIFIFNTKIAPFIAVDPDDSINVRSIPLATLMRP